MPKSSKHNARGQEASPKALQAYLAWLNAKVTDQSEKDFSEPSASLGFAYASKKAYKGCLLFDIDIEQPPMFASYGAGISSEIEVGRCKVFRRWFQKLQYAIEKSPQKDDAYHPSNEDWEILHAPAQIPQQVITHTDIEQATRISRRTISSRLKLLMDVDLAAHPAGKKRGVCLTSRGLELLSRK